MTRPIGVLVVAIVLMVTGVFVLLLGLEEPGSRTSGWRRLRRTTACTRRR